MNLTPQPVAEKRSASVEPAGERALAEQWLDKFNVALHSASPSSVAMLFAPESHWRDLLAFTWSITPSQGAEAK